MGKPPRRLGCCRGGGGTVIPSNVEVKARARDLAGLRRLAEGLTDGPAEVIRQEDTFFNCPAGRLKLRTLAPDRGELIYYEREDTAGPRPSTYVISPTENPDSLRTALTSALGVRGVVRKRRYLYRSGQTRIHLDEVDGLGPFVELEVVLRPDQSPDDGARIAADLMAQLGIRDEDLVTEAYVDLLT